jgi:predicted nucleic acid-binding protein
VKPKIRRIVTDINILTRHALSRCKRNTCPWWVGNAARDARTYVNVEAVHALIRWITEATEQRDWYHSGEYRALMAAQRLARVMPAIEAHRDEIREHFEWAA